MRRRLISEIESGIAETERRLHFWREQLTGEDATELGAHVADQIVATLERLIERLIAAREIFRT